MDKKITAHTLEDGRISVLLPQFLANKFADYFYEKTGLNLSPDPVVAEGAEDSGMSRTEPVMKLMSEVEFFVESWLALEQIKFERVTVRQDPEETSWSIDAQEVDIAPRHKNVPGIEPAPR